MKRRITWSIVGVSAIALLVLGIPLAIAVGRLYRNDAVLQLEREASETRRAINVVQLTRNDPVELTNREYALLEVFMHNQGRVLPRTLIAEKIWSSHYDVETNLLDVYMSRLRAKVEGVLGKPAFKTVRGVGYQLV